ncbi:MAG: pilus assembly protein PilP [Nitrospirae bacterium]|nr:pilus assembly protein PilP [Nitrospirota bacterium]
MLISTELSFLAGAQEGKPETQSLLEKNLVIVPYEYKPSGRRDPFLSILELNKRRRKQLQKGTKDTRILSPLETANLPSIKLIGIVIDQRDKYASVVLSDGRYFVIKQGAYLGTNGGKVYDIKPDRVIVKEETMDDVGKPLVKTISICLSPEESIGCNF